VLVTGCGGFVGPYVAEALAGAGYEAWGADLKGEVALPSLRRYVPCDLGDPAAVDALLREEDFAAVVHLAAQSSAGKSFAEPFETITRNVFPILSILDFARKSASGMRILAVGSGDVYGPVDGSDLPLAESRPPNPVNPYALSKAIQEQACVHYASLYGVDAVVTRSFNHTGSGQRESFVLSSFARQICEVRLGMRDPVLMVGNLDLRRDFCDVRDVSLAYAALLEKGAGGDVYNVCSGVSWSLRELLGRMIQTAGVEVEIRVDADRVRPADMEELRGDPSKIFRDTGWRPRIPIDETLSSLLEYWSRTLREAGRKSG
jgi:GDP-4-dehydro-6-deoxy-D-mannose reductase